MSDWQSAVSGGFGFSTDESNEMSGVPSADHRTLLRLAWRHLAVRRGRAAVLLFGYAVGTAVMMVLLSVGEAMLVQARDVSLVGGGEVTVLPEGIDLEALRTGSMGSMFFGIDRARFLERQLVGGGRMGDVVGPTSPVIEHKLVYLKRGNDLVTLRAGAEIPSRAAATGAGLDILEGTWRDSPADRRFATPTPEELYHEIDRWHSPRPDPTWAEWHYFNIAPSGDEWWYLTFLIGGQDGAGRSAGQVLITRHRADAPPARFEARYGADRVVYDTTRADVRLGMSSVQQRDGRYRIIAEAVGPRGVARLDLTVTPTPNAYFPPVEIQSNEFRSGYVVPAVRGTATGTICESGRCRTIRDVAAYHDHNWGVWRETTWNWGQARGSHLSVVYGGVLPADSVASADRSPYFLAVVDSLGVRQILRFREIIYRGSHGVVAGTPVPATLQLTAVREADTVQLDATVRSAQTTAVGGSGRQFLQMRAAFTLRGRLLAVPVTDSGLGFFETFVERSP